MKKRFLSLILVICMIVSCVMSIGFSASAESVDAASTGEEDYGLAQNCEDGNTLHCFNWTLNQIKAELPNIAEAGFTSVQTSPLQTHSGSTKWYWLYQPNGFTLGNEIGSYNNLKSLCTEADKYGIKIIVDVVANHVAGDKNGNLAYSVENVFKTNKSTYFHNAGPMPDNCNVRNEITHKNIGMPDLNSENANVQNMVVDMVNQLKDAGVDGIRWDAAKHISLPSESCNFWSKMSRIDLYQYGEILDTPAGSDPNADNEALMNEYAQYIGVTDSKYSTDFFTALRSGMKYKSDGYWNAKGVAKNKIVYWAESHDTYANDGGMTKNEDQNTIDKAYAILGAKADSQALYLSRPAEKDKERINYGVKGSTHFTSPEVAAVNHFHNAMIGTDEYYYSSARYDVVTREGGAVIVSLKGGDIDVSVTSSNFLTPNGTYTDEVSGNTWTVADGKITGHIGESGIAVIYNTEPTEPTVEPTEPPTEPPVVEKILGDADGNGEVESIDATLPQRDLAFIDVPDYYDPDAADVDRDGEVTSLDVTYLQRWLAMIDVPYPIGEVVTT